MADNSYHSEYQKQRYAERKARATELLGGQCSSCSSVDDLQFDHVDPETKSYNITRMFSKYSWGAIAEELTKCQLLCVDCHIAKSQSEALGRRAWNAGTKKIHGSYYGVYTLKCSCGECAEYREERLARRRICS